MCIKMSWKKERRLSTLKIYRNLFHGNLESKNGGLASILFALHELFGCYFKRCAANQDSYLRALLYP